MNLSIYWTVAKHTQFQSEATFLDLSTYDQVTNDPAWPQGYRVWEFDVSDPNIALLDDMAEAHTCINFYPSPRPPYSPTGR